MVDTVYRKIILYSFVNLLPPVSLFVLHLLKIIARNYIDKSNQLTNMGVMILQILDPAIFVVFS